MIGPALASLTELNGPTGSFESLMDGAHKPSLAEAARGFESIFLSLLLKEMRQTLEPGSLFGKDGGDVYGGLFDQFMSQHLAQGKGMGIAQSLIQQLEPKTSHETPRDVPRPGT
jgi:flagellar protein FlgJ